jgi:hypothetical protein
MHRIPSRLPHSRSAGRRSPVRQLALALGVLALAGTLAACASKPSMPAPDATVRSELAPSGKLRAAINLGNPILASKDATLPARMRPAARRAASRSTWRASLAGASACRWSW